MLKILSAHEPTATVRTALPLIAAAALLLSAIIPPTTAHAAEPRSVTVAYGDLDLVRPEDTARLYARLIQAARTVCEPPVSGSLARIAASHRCVRDTVAAAVARVGVPQLTAYHAEKAGVRG